MAVKPILFSAPMVRALLAGTKTQTRRILNPQPRQWEARVIDILPPSQDEEGNWGQVETVWSGPLVPGMCEPDHERWHPLPVRLRVGDRLYVREAFSGPYGCRRLPPRDWPIGAPIWYWADGEPQIGDFTKAKPGMHMPRWASRLTLTVTDVRVERLLSISEADAIAEGIEDVTREVAAGDPSLRFWKRYRDGGWNGYVDTAVASYASLWTEINGPGSWDANPWVAAYTFTVHRTNIDQLEAA